MRSIQVLRKQQRQRGTSAVEFVLMISFVLIMVFFAFDLMMFVYSYSVLADAAKEGVRYAVVHGCGTDSTTCSGLCTPACADAAGDNVSNKVKDFAKLTFHNTSAMTVNVNYLDGGGSAASPNRVRIVIQYPYASYFALGWGPTIKAA